MRFETYLKRAAAVLLMAVLTFGIFSTTASAASKTSAKKAASTGTGKKTAKKKAQTTREQLTDITSDLKIVLIGDSYTTHPAKESKRVPACLKKELKLKDASFISACRSGSGFTKSGYRSFTRLIKSLKKDRTVTHVVFVGSLHNDKRSTASSTMKSCKKINTLLRKKFPNAAVLVAAPNWHTNNSMWRLQVQVQSARLKRACAACGWTYLQGIDRVLHGHPNYFEKDGHQPNAKGAKAIAKKLASEIRKAAREGGYIISESNVGDKADGELSGTRLALTLYLNEKNSCETDDKMVDSESGSSAEPVSDSQNEVPGDNPSGPSEGDASSGGEDSGETDSSGDELPVDGSSGGKS